MRERDGNRGLGFWWQYGSTGSTRGQLGSDMYLVFTLLFLRWQVALRFSWKRLTAEESIKQKKLEAQWPKRCGCGKVYHDDIAFNIPGKLAWMDLPLAKNKNAPFGHYQDAFADQEMRNCSCGSTLVVLTEIHDLTQE